MTLPSPICIWRSFLGWRSWFSSGARTSGHIMIDVEEHKNVMVIVSKCQECGTQHLGWRE